MTRENTGFQERLASKKREKEFTHWKQREDRATEGSKGKKRERNTGMPAPKEATKKRKKNFNAKQNPKKFNPS